ncbi:MULTISPECIES: GNAT family N-acetyltransferase [Bacillus amyloliquefaciens group]|uniref:GNAT family N-acetyltransferase n=3 Tax=Bacillaceae TaxID=186817 RepID=UPI00077D76C0|nr:MULTISPECIES: GNAT family N-acetyltransferase [Bacillus amyloliquefaciens group]AMQ74221.1 N-acetyltransferase GCN5 [Bacillus amyloliquefaciens UMAF6614]AWM48076.1 N-acetyltransferase [Bacillus amyloliquefaciens]MBF6668137.1 GNAT family N-acetyltransferase [Bacillus velezensis]
MDSYQVKKLKPEEYHKCNNIWDMEKKKKMAKVFYDELVSGNRITFIYSVNDEFIGEGSLVFQNNDPDYTIPDKRIYLSRMIVKEGYRNCGIGGIIVDFLIDYAKQLGFEEITLGVDTDNLNARHLYEKKGFTTVLFLGEDEYGEYVKLLKVLK